MTRRDGLNSEESALDLLRVGAGDDGLATKLPYSLAGEAAHAVALVALHAHDLAGPRDFESLAERLVGFHLGHDSHLQCRRGPRESGLKQQKPTAERSATPAWQLGPLPAWKHAAGIRQAGFTVNIRPVTYGNPERGKAPDSVSIRWSPSPFAGGSAGVTTSQRQAWKLLGSKDRGDSPAFP
jgi:hypothetical protein